MRKALGDKTLMFGREDSGNTGENKFTTNGKRIVKSRVFGNENVGVCLIDATAADGEMLFT